MKRKEPPSTPHKSPPKKARPEVPEYHLTPTIKEEDGSVQWPAPSNELENARRVIRECAASQEKTLIVPDKDADGLSAGAILRKTLILLGLKEDLIHVHLLSKGNTVHSEEERKVMSSFSPTYIFVIDHGSRSGPPVIDEPHTSLVIDHHHATPSDFPEGSHHVSACNSPPVATSALLTYEICLSLHPSVYPETAWLCIVGTHGDLGNTLKWQPPFPDMRETFKQYTKKLLNDIVSLLNAPRRTANFDSISAWNALMTDTPSTILKNPRLLAARAEINAEVERCTHTAPKFSPDGKIAVFRISSPAQIHPVIATRWAGHLNSKALEIVMVANEGYLPGKVNFSCRIPRCARGRDPAVSIIDRLKYFATLTEPDTSGMLEKGEERGPPESWRGEALGGRLGDDFARGHVQASGGIVGKEEFEELMWLMQIGVKAAKNKRDGVGSSPAGRKKIDPGQKNTLMGYFGKKTEDATVVH